MKISDKHQKIIQAAINVFARKGFFNARISDIAKEAQVADGTIYLYFNNKFDILISLFEDEIGKLILQIKNLIEKEDDPRQMLRVFAIHHLQLLKDKRELAEVLQMELRQSNKFIKEYRNTKFIEYIDIISAIIRKGQALGLFRKEILPGLAKRAFFGALDEVSRLWVLSPNPRYTIEEAAQQVSDLFLSGLLTQERQANSCIGLEIRGKTGKG
jgi:TetR/AcrR family transcriptional regulator, fatty acid metabolism regulator protein